VTGRYPDEPPCICTYWLDTPAGREDRLDKPNCPYHHPKED
jgi:hypothetical protein